MRRGIQPLSIEIGRLRIPEKSSQESVGLQLNNFDMQAVEKNILDKQVVVVSGGAGLLGRNFVRCIAEQGGIAVVADLNLRAATELAEEVSKNHPRQAEPAYLDITDKRSVTDLIDKIHVRHGHIDALVNSAYPRNNNYGRTLEALTYKDFCENVNLHLGGYFLIAQQFSLYFRDHGGGNIINLASIYGSMVPRFAIYSGTNITMPLEYAAIKSAVIQITRYFAQYFKNDRIRVNCLSPGGILDNQPNEFLQQYAAHCGEKGLLNPSDIMGALIFLLSDSSRYITGQNLIIDDGFSL